MSGLPTLIAVDALDASSIRDADYVVFGGTFDPPHLGHISVLRALLHRFQRVILAPTSQNPWKTDRATPIELRTRMLELILAAESIPLAGSLGDVGVSITTHPYVYSEELVAELRRRIPGKISWAVGEDSAESVSKWRNWDALEVQTIVCPVVIDDHAAEIREGSKSPHPSLVSLINEHGLYSGPASET
ncbi:MAG: adenylyltransferase/cytidyltransferase family protein [Deltaproteobacteria bacterium]|nr:adenylyltransferase/cytidyltransferase family protein [Deltaproteobacteria bacterium]